MCVKVLRPQDSWIRHARQAALSVAIGLLLTAFGVELATGAVLTAVAVSATAAIGLTFVTAAGGIDLSVGSVGVLSASVAGYCVSTAGMPLPLAIAVALAIGVLCGLLNGVLITRAGLPSFMATFGVLGVAGGMAAGLPVPSGPSGADLLDPAAVWAAAGMIAVGAQVLLGHTAWGFHVFFAGSNEVAAEHAGIPVSSLRRRVYVISGASAAVAGVMMPAPPGAGGAIELELAAVGAVVLGGATLSGGRGTVLGSVLGAVLLVLSATVLEVRSYWWQCILAVVVVVVTVLNQALAPRRDRTEPGRT
jgi:ribose transport system permease protein